MSAAASTPPSERPTAPDSTVLTAAAGFARRFGQSPNWLALAPGRVNLIGEHTDYNGGFVLPMAIERHTVLAASLAHPAAPAATSAKSTAALPRTIRIQSDAQPTAASIDLDAPLRPGAPAWANYMRGVVAGFERRGFEIPALNVFVTSSVPLGGGLSSSAALEVATATLLESVVGTVLSPLEKARLCRQAEHEFAGVPCGLMDQLASVLGDARGALLIDCQAETARVVPFANPAVSVLICNTNVRHALADGEYARRRAQCIEAAAILGVRTLRDATLEMVTSPSGAARASVAAAGPSGEVALRRARHVVTENGRTLAAAACLEGGEFGAVGELMYQSHASLRDDYEVSCAELDALVEAAQLLGVAGGVYGSRMTGGGFGGSTVTLVDSARVESVAAFMAASYQKRIGRTMSYFVSRPASGAHLISRGAPPTP